MPEQALGVISLGVVEDKISCTSEHLFKVTLDMRTSCLTKTLWARTSYTEKCSSYNDTPEIRTPL